MMKFNLCIFFLLVSKLLFSQVEKEFAHVDSWAEKQKLKKNLGQLVTDLTQPFSSDFDKTRAIYIWIIRNVAYDVKTYNQSRSLTRFKCNDKENCEGEYQDFEQKIIERALKKKLAVCSGYAKLFCRMSSLAGIQCVEIDGFIKNKPSHAGEMGILDHAWNGVIINNKMHFIDVTWAAGVCSKGKGRKLKKFSPQQNDFYWMTPTEKFHLDHFPKDVKKVSNLEISEETFKSFPFIHSAFIPSLEIISPQDKIIRANKGDTIHFHFKLPLNVTKIQINNNVIKNPKYWKKNKKGKLVERVTSSHKQVYIPFSKQNGQYYFSYIVPENGIQYLDILFNHKTILRFKVVKKEL